MKKKRGAYQSCKLISSTQKVENPTTNGEPNLWRY